MAQTESIDVDFRTGLKVMPIIWIKDLPDTIPEKVRECIKQTAKNHATRKIEIDECSATAREFGHFMSGYTTFGRRIDIIQPGIGKRFKMAPGGYVIERRQGLRVNDKTRVILHILK